MLMLILITHIAIASLLTAATLKVSLAAYRQEVSAAYRPMLFAFAATAVSGVGLLLVGTGGIGRICATMSAVTLVVFVVRHYYRVRVIAQTV